MLLSFLPVPGSWRGGWWEQAYRLGLDRPLVNQAGRAPPEEDITGLGLDWELPPPATLQPWVTGEVLVLWLIAGGVLYGLGTMALAENDRRRWRDLLRVAGVVAGPGAWAWAQFWPDLAGVAAGGWPGSTGWALAALAVVMWEPGRSDTAGPSSAQGTRKGDWKWLGPAVWALFWAGLLSGGVPVAAVLGVWLAGGWHRWRRGGSGPLAAVVAGGWGGLVVSLGAVLLLNEATPTRLAVHRDVAVMVADQPLIGVGPGNFEALFPQYRRASAGPHPVPHARSDWTQLAAERGLPGLVAVGFVLALALRRGRRLEQAEDAALRAGPAAGFLMLLVGSLWDVPWHVPGVALTGLLLFILARPLRRPQWGFFLHPLVWRGLGGVTMALGLTYSVSALVGLPLHSAVVMPVRPVSLTAGDNPPWPLERWSEHMAAVGQQPLSSREYFERARTRAAFGKFPRLLPVDFARARFLSPDRPELPLWEGVAWWPRSRDEAWAAWSRALAHPQADRAAVWEVIRATVPAAERSGPRWAYLTERYPEGSR